MDGTALLTPEQFASLKYGDGPKRRDVLRRLDLESWRGETLVDDGRIIRLFAVSREPESPNGP